MVTDVFQVSHEIIRHPVAPWIMRIMHAYEGDLSLTRAEMAGALKSLIDRNKLKSLSGYEHEIDSAYQLLMGHHLIQSEETGYSLTELGRMVGKYVIPAVSETIYREIK